MCIRIECKVALGNFKSYLYKALSIISINKTCQVGIEFQVREVRAPSRRYGYGDVVD
jgi:hypothetical protein